MLDDSLQEPKTITLSQEAEIISEQFYNELEPRLGKDGDLEHMADWAGKLHGEVLRIAGLLHVVYNASLNGKGYSDIPFEDYLAITGKTMAAAVELGQYFLAHAIACYGILGGSEAERGAVYILEKLKKQSLSQFTVREILRLCKKFKTSQDLTEPLAVLAEHGYIRETKAEYTGTGRPQGNIYQVNPIFIQD